MSGWRGLHIWFFNVVETRMFRTGEQNGDADRDRNWEAMREF
jgi:hypothetical protein